MHYGIEYSYCATVRHVEERKGERKKKEKRITLSDFHREKRVSNVFSAMFSSSAIYYIHISGCRHYLRLLTTTYDYFAYVPR